MPALEIATRFDWDTFVRRYWNQRPVLFKGTRASPFTVEDVFEASAGATRRYLSRSYPPTSRPDVTFTVDRLRQLRSREWLPRASDGSLDGYDARIAAQLGQRRYALIIATLHASSFPLWSRQRAFFAGLWQRVGLPVTGGITTLFHGTYEHSPVGVHLDRFTTFLFALRGRKRMRFWRKRPLREDVSTILDYQPYLASSFVAEVEPGDILYRPSTYYHVGESAGTGVASSVNVGIPITEHHAIYSVDDLLRGMLDETSLADQEWKQTRLARVSASPLARGALTKSGVLATALPQALTEAVSAFREVSHPKEARRHLQATWLKRLTSGGFEPVPPPTREKPLRDSHLVRVDPSFPVLFERDGATRWICSANGHALRGVGGGRAVEILFRKLNSGTAVGVKAVLSPFRTRRTARHDSEIIAATREGMRELLKKLHAFHAITLSA
ncbi:cupin domain-containing protein [Myxococcus sp. SDU36]|uniref:JmjC domain-containing protein n=1 Tax=Myxococcus sp. SDU36 TaxID=2831967 RepID=UPI002542BE0F|nr:cupin domain-containing protein [Myxococcus sp. SDU36]WIG97795.1 cupin domain-containing protein [Myxococcus sp. SDU36]